MVIMQTTAVCSTRLAQASSTDPPSLQQMLWVVGSTWSTGLSSSPRMASTSVSLVALTHMHLHYLITMSVVAPGTAVSDVPVST